MKVCLQAAADVTEDAECQSSMRSVKFWLVGVTYNRFASQHSLLQKIILKGCAIRFVWSIWSKMQWCFSMIYIEVKGITVTYEGKKSHTRIAAQLSSWPIFVRTLT